MDLSSPSSLRVRNHTMLANLRYESVPSPHTPPPLRELRGCSVHGGGGVSNKASDRLFFCVGVQEVVARGCVHLSMETEEYFVPALYLLPHFKVQPHPLGECRPHSSHPRRRSWTACSPTAA